MAHKLNIIDPNSNFDRDTIKFNIEDLLRKDVGTRPGGPGTAPLFTNEDVQRHAELISPKGSPVSVVEPTGRTILSAQGQGFSGLDNPALQTERDLTIQIGDLKGRQLENAARLGELIQNDPATQSAQQQVDILSMELATTTNAANAAEVQRELLIATRNLDNANKSAEARAGLENTKLNNRLGADIVRLEAQRQVLVDERARIGKEKEFRAPDFMLDGVVTAGITQTRAQAEKVIMAAQPVTRELIREMTQGVKIKRPLEGHSPLVDAGGRDMWESYILGVAQRNGNEENTAIAIEQMNARIARSRSAAKKETERLKKGNKALLTDPKAVAAKEAELFDQNMRAGNFVAFEAKAIQGSSADLQEEWFIAGSGQFEIAKRLQDSVQPDATSIETAYLVEAEKLMQEGVDIRTITDVMGRMLDNQRTNWDLTNRLLGQSASQSTLSAKIGVLSANLVQVKQAEAQRELMMDALGEAGFGPGIPSRGGQPGARGAIGLGLLQSPGAIPGRDPGLDAERRRIQAMNSEASGLGVNPPATAPSPSAFRREAEASVREGIESEEFSREFQDELQLRALDQAIAAGTPVPADQLQALIDRISDPEVKETAKRMVKALKRITAGRS